MPQTFHLFRYGELKHVISHSECFDFAQNVPVCESLFHLETEPAKHMMAKLISRVSRVRAGGKACITSTYNTQLTCPARK